MPIDPYTTKQVVDFVNAHRAASPLPVALPARSLTNEEIAQAVSDYRCGLASGEFPDVAFMRGARWAERTLAAPLDTSTTAAAPTDATNNEIPINIQKVGVAAARKHDGDYISYGAVCAAYRAMSALASAQAVPPVAPTDAASKVEITKLRNALKPFANHAKHYDEGPHGHPTTDRISTEQKDALTCGHLFKARAALKGNAS